MAIAAAAALGRPAAAQRMEAAPEELSEVGVEEHLNAPLPLELAFTDSSGKPVEAGRVFRQPETGHPDAQLLQLPDALQLAVERVVCRPARRRLEPRRQVPDGDREHRSREPSERAAETKQKYLEIYGRANVEQGWHFLTGEERNIRQLAKTVGFGYTYDAATQQYLHAAVTFVCTPDGRVSRYLYGIEYPPQTVRLALLEAAEGKIGTTMDKVLMFCFQYDEQKGQYTLAAVNLMRAGGVATLLFLAGMLGWYCGGNREGKKLDPQAV